MPTRRPILKRVVVWTAAVVLVLAAYAVSSPFVFFWSQRHLPGAIPTLQVVYAPLIVYARHPEWPGSESVNRFQSRMNATIREYTEGPARVKVALDSQTRIQFTGTPLRDVVNFVSEIHDIPIKLEGQINDDIEITIHSTASLRDALAEALEPLGLVAAADQGQIVIGTPETIEWIIARRRADNPLIAWGPWIALAIGLLSVGALSLLLRRMIVKRHARTTTAE